MTLTTCVADCFIDGHEMRPIDKPGQLVWKYFEVEGESEGTLETRKFSKCPCGCEQLKADPPVSIRRTNVFCETTYEDPFGSRRVCGRLKHEGESHVTHKDLRDEAARRGLSIREMDADMSLDTFDAEIELPLMLTDPKPSWTFTANLISEDEKEDE